MDNSLPNIYSCTVAVIGLGYVGLPLAVELAKTNYCFRTKKMLRRKIIGFDINEERINQLKSGIDNTNEISKDILLGLGEKIQFTSNPNDIAKSDLFLMTVPTPVDEFNMPIFNPLISASKTIGKVLKTRLKLIEKDKKNNFTKPIIIFESTVYPGATEEKCVPIIEEESNYIYNKDFYCGYSPERINPGDKEHTLTNIKKVTSGSTEIVAKLIDNFYSSFIKAGTHLTESIRIAEASKIIENIQRDINIALINELSMLFHKMEIDTHAVLDAAASKWNFIPFKPGLVGGHCIGVDPYYLTYKANEIGFNPRMILAGRSINDDMADWITERLVLLMSRRKINIGNSKVLVLGFSFKENCSDIRNTQVIKLIKALNEYSIEVDIVDPCVDIVEVFKMYKLKNLTNTIDFQKKYSAIVCAVAHKEFCILKKNQWEKLLEKNAVIFDIKSIVPKVMKPFRL